MRTRGRYGIGRVGLEHDGNLAGVEPHEISRGIDADQLDEAAHQILIELLAVVPLQHRQDAVGREAPADRRAAIASRRTRPRCRTASSPRFSCGRRRRRVAGAVGAQVMLEGDDRRERRHLRRVPEDLGAVDGVALQDLELLRRSSLSGLFRISFGVFTLPMSCISAASPNSRSSAPSIPSAARLAHGEDRHVHHVRERVVVVVLQRGEREQRRSVLRDRLRQRIDHAARGVRVGHAFGAGAVPQTSPPPSPRRRTAAGTSRCRRRARRVCSSTCSRPDADVRQIARAPRSVAGLAARDTAHELLDLVALHAAVDDDALDAGLLERGASARPSFRRLADRDVADDQVFADDADRDRWHGLVSAVASVSMSARHAAGDERMTRRVELRAANRRGQASRGDRRRVARVRRRSRRLLLSGRNAVPTWALAALRTPRLPWRSGFVENRQCLRRPECCRASGRGMAERGGSERRPPCAAVQDVLQRANRFRRGRAGCRARRSCDVDP